MTTCIPVEVIHFEIGHFSDFRTLVTLTLTLNQVIQHIVVYHSSTSTYKPNAEGQTDTETNFIGILGGVDLINKKAMLSQGTA